MPGSAESQEVMKLKEKIYQRVGEWIFRHWTQLASGLGGVLTGVAGMYVMFSGQISASAAASQEAKNTANDLKPIVQQLQDTVRNLATRDYVDAKTSALAQWQADHQQLPKNSEVDEAMKLPPHRGHSAPHK